MVSFVRNAMVRMNLHEGSTRMLHYLIYYNLVMRCDRSGLFTAQLHYSV